MINCKVVYNSNFFFGCDDGFVRVYLFDYTFQYSNGFSKFYCISRPPVRVIHNIHGV